jgi:oligoribonuclease (3'-5' exoribonuclease)
MQINKFAYNHIQDLSKVFVSSQGLKIEWFDRWNPVLDEALDALPALTDYPRELYVKLCQNPGPARKIFALLSENKAPVSLAWLRQKHSHWEPLAQWLLPGAIFPVKPGYFIRTLEVLGLDLWIGFWRWNSPPQCSKLIRYYEDTSTYGIDCRFDYESYWREVGHYKNIRLRRNRCNKFKFVVNVSGTLEWTIKNWERKWRMNPNIESSNLEDQLFIARYLNKIGQYIVFSLLDQDEIIAGATLMVQGKDLVAGVNFRKPEYDWYGVGIYLLDQIFQWASTSGYRNLDIGGLHSYKEKWAPKIGHRYVFNICPEHLYLIRQGGKWLRTHRPKIRSNSRKL